MLKNSFLHIPKVSKDVELKLWNNGIYNWDDFTKNGHSLVPDNKKEFMCKYLNICNEEYKKQNHRFFTSLLELKEHWRAYPDFKNSCAYLDIETTGLSKERNKITTIGVYDGEKSRVFIRHKDLDEFPEFIKNYKMIVTFNGRCFDLPFIQYNFPEIDFDQFHIDLRFVLKELGYSGGLKRIEKDLKITRDDDLEGVDGYQAVRLWYKYRKGDEAALQKLIKYNIADVENLKAMMEFAYDKMKEKHFLSNL